MLGWIIVEIEQEPSGVANQNGQANQMPQFQSSESLSSLLAFNRLNPQDIDAAYQHCRALTREGSKTFYFASISLPQPKRQAMWALYSFCRFTDDIVDAAEKNLSLDDIGTGLAQWELNLRQAVDGYVLPERPDMVAWAHTFRQFKMPMMPPLELVEGVRMDLYKSRYANFDELRLYCYRVASTVGLMASQIIGYRDPVALEYAVNLGIAMQLTNILRDVGEDAARGRIYIPQDELQEYGYTEAELLRGQINERFVRLMQFQIARARHYYEQSIPGIELLDERCRLGIAVAAQLYSRILNRIEVNKYDVFTRRAFVPTHQKIGNLASVWLRRRFGSPPLTPQPLLHTPENQEADA
jgi:15-cis-phytoene synthase